MVLIKMVSQAKLKKFDVDFIGYEGPFALDGY